jgi:hypothetical protein
MAGEWLKFEASTPEKPEVFAMTAALGWDDPDYVVGKLLKVWRWFDQHTIDGHAPNVTLALLDRISGVSGFAKAMCGVGWLSQAEAGLTLPNFDRHNGKTAKDRALTAKRVAKHKAGAAMNDGGDGAGNSDSNGDSVSDGVNAALAREEKKREELTTGPASRRAGLKGKSAVAFKAYVEQCKAEGVKPVPEDDAVFQYAADAGIPDEFLRLQWCEFRDRYQLPDAKRYRDWRSVFRKSVRGNWFRLWYAAEDGYQLTTQGQQAKKIHEGKP